MHKNLATLEDTLLAFALMHPGDFKSILSINALLEN